MMRLSFHVLPRSIASLRWLRSTPSTAFAYHDCIEWQASLEVTADHNLLQRMAPLGLLDGHQLLEEMETGLGDRIAEGREVAYDCRMTLWQPRTALATICFCTTCGMGVSAGMGLLPGCAGASANPDDVAPSDAAVNICNENVPADHIVDGIPAYASCDAALATVYSNNGVNTRTTSAGADWVRTQWAYGYQCTEYVQRYLYFRWKVDAIFDINAAEFCTHPLPSNLVKTTTPVHGDVMVFGSGSCGAGASGHIAVVDTVDTATSQVTIVDENNVGRGNYAKRCGTCYLHATANDGSTDVGGTSGTGGGPGSGGS